MSLATDRTADVDHLVVGPDRAAPLRSAAWDRIFVHGGAWLVPVPIVAFELLRRSGLSVAAAEDLVTLLVMVPLGGPHVFATYTRTLFNPRFRQQDRWLFGLAFAVIAVVVAAAVSSAFFDVLIGGSPPIRYVLTFFFFWAGVHIVQQNAYIAACYADKAPARRRSRVDIVDYAVMLLAMYPVSLFRMSMVDPLDPTMRSADPEALASRIVVALTGSPHLADEYVFRIGRVAPILPPFMAHAACWIAVSAAFAVSLAVFLLKTLRQHRAGECLRARTRLVFWMALLGFVVPLFPNLDSAFQGLNAWHSFQYLGLLWLMNRNSFERGEIRGRVFDHLMQPGRHWRLYGTAVLATVGLLGVVLLSGCCIDWLSRGEFALFGHDAPRLGADGRELYRPGAVLLGYYIVAFSLLLVHYLHDGVFFFRKRYLLGPARQ
jgi:hypothetical protein